MFEGGNSVAGIDGLRFYLSFRPPVFRTTGTEPYRMAIIYGWETGSGLHSRIHTINYQAEFLKKKTIKQKNGNSGLCRSTAWVVF